MPLKEGAEYLIKVGLLDVILPFILVFTTLYGLLQRVKPFGKDSERTNASICAIIGLIIVGIANYVQVIQKFVIYFTAFAILIVFVIIIASSLGFKEYKTKDWTKNLPAIISISAIALIVLASFAFFDYISYELFNDALPVVVFLLAMAGIIYFIVKPSKGSVTSQQRTSQQTSRPSQQERQRERQQGPPQREAHELQRQPGEIEPEDEGMVPISKEEALEMLRKKLERKRKALE